MTVQEAMQVGFGAVADLVAGQAAIRPDTRALVQGSDVRSYRELDTAMDRIAAGLQHEGIAAGDAVALLSATTVEAVSAFFGILRAGCVPVPIAPSATTAQTDAMIADCGARLVFVDADGAAGVSVDGVAVVRLDRLEAWLPDAGTRPTPVPVGPEDRFNIIYSSGTTGTPKGIVHTHAMRWTQIAAYAATGLDDAVMMVATPLYSNTTLVSLLPTIALGGTAVLLGKFDARAFLEVAERERATHAMLVPVQYQRIMAVPDFDAFDLSCFRIKTCTSAPFSPELKRDIVARWPGMLLEIYAMTEGGGTCLLMANAFPDKLHTVGQPAPGSDVRIIDETGAEVARGAIGEIVGRSGMMMRGYHGRQADTDTAAWYDRDGNRFLRHGDLGRFDEDGFLVLLGRTKDMIISGGFNVYPPDIEAVLLDHPAVADAAVIGVPSDAWGETPHAFYVASDRTVAPDEVLAWVNARVGRTQRLAGIERIDELPRSAIGKVLKRELRDRYETANHRMDA
jgi:acyl-CoA synthetase (AMP-forming)/AMP-acid ligase II